jgi:hypothetical protein
MTDSWYYAAGDKSVGPLSLADLTTILSRASNAKDVLVWRAGFEQWQRAATVAELAAFVIKPPKPPPLPPRLPPLTPTKPSGPSSMAPATAKNHEDRPKQQKTGSSGSRVDESNGKYGLKPHGYWVFGVS